MIIILQVWQKPYCNTTETVILNVENITIMVTVFEATSAI